LRQFKSQIPSLYFDSIDVLPHMVSLETYILSRQEAVSDPFRMRARKFPAFAQASTLDTVNGRQYASRRAVSPRFRRGHLQGERAKNSSPSGPAEAGVSGVPDLQTRQIQPPDPWVAGDGRGIKAGPEPGGRILKSRAAGSCARSL
jgi:hypothetical protein